MAVALVGPGHFLSLSLIHVFFPSTRSGDEDYDNDEDQDEDYDNDEDKDQDRDSETRTTTLEEVTMSRFVTRPIASMLSVWTRPHSTCCIG